MEAISSTKVIFDLKKKSQFLHAAKGINIRIEQREESISEPKRTRTREDVWGLWDSITGVLELLCFKKGLTIAKV